MKYLLVLLVVVIGLYALMGRVRRPRSPDAPPQPGRAPPPAAPSTAKAAATPMLACAHCGVHLPSDEAALDAAGRGYCGDAHRLAGPR